MRRTVVSMTLSGLLLVAAGTPVAGQLCQNYSTDYSLWVINTARVCIQKYAPRGLSCAAYSRYLAPRVTRVNTTCPAGTVARLNCTARQMLIASGFNYSALVTANFPQLCTTGQCGDGVLEAGEQCDDGNVQNGDGCSATCQLESTSCSDACAGIPTASGTAIKSQLFASGLSKPLYVTAPAGDVGRVFVVEKTGGIRIVKWGTLLATPFLTLSTKITNGSEQGLLSVAFHPNYASNGKFYVDYTDKSGNTVVSSFHVSGNPDVADATSESIILQVLQPFANHNGGLVKFGPDGYLYVGLGDGGSGGDPFGNGQNGTTLLGKLLRIDIDSATPYAIPPTNPFVGADPRSDEIWALGLRNPWRFSFDRLNGDLYIGDVGQDAYEEIDYQPGGNPGGANYGWNIMEGNHCYNPPVGCDPTGLVAPVLEYPHGPGDSIGCSVTGGYVYRGCAMPDLRGRYFYSDYCTAFIKSFVMSGGAVTDPQDHTAALAPTSPLHIASVASFGEDARGELYFCDIALGNVYKIIPGP